MSKNIMSIIMIGVVILIASSVFIACNQNELEPVAEQGIEYPIPENAEVITELINLGFPIVSAQPNADYVMVGDRARFYSLPHDIKNYDKYVELIKSGGENGTILKVTIGDKKEGYAGNLILKVEETDDLDEKAELEVIYSSMEDENGNPILNVEYLDPKAVDRVEARDEEGSNMMQN